MKNHNLFIKLVVCCSAVLMYGSSYAEEVRGRVLTTEQLDAIVKADVGSCYAQTPQPNGLASGQTNPAMIIPTANAKFFPQDRITRTLNGIWLGKVIGDTGEVGVDYFWIIDAPRKESLIIAQRSGKQTVTGQPIANAPKFSYLMCAHEGYFPSKDVPQLQEFTKVSDSIVGAAKIMQQATGLRLKNPRETLSDMWKELVAIGYFDNARFANEHGQAYAGGMFTGLDIEAVENVVGAPDTSIKWNAEYRGGGSTAIKFQNNVPILGVEFGQFVGATATAGDYLVASPGNGRLWKVETFSGAQYGEEEDLVALGPLYN